MRAHSQWIDVVFVSLVRKHQKPTTKQDKHHRKKAAATTTKTTTIKTRTKLEPNILPSFRITTLPHIHHFVVIFLVAGRFKFTVWLAQRKTWTHSKKWFQFGPMTSTKCLCMSYHRHWFGRNRKIYSVSYIHSSHWWWNFLVFDFLGKLFQRKFDGNSWLSERKNRIDSVCVCWFISIKKSSNSKTFEFPWNLFEIFRINAIWTVMNRVYIKLKVPRILLPKKWKK